MTRAALLAGALSLGTPGSDWPIWTAGFDASQGPSVRDGAAMAYVVVVFEVTQPEHEGTYEQIPLNPTWTASTGELAKNVWTAGDMGIRPGRRFAGYEVLPYTGVSNSCDRRESDGWENGWCDAMGNVPTGDQAFYMNYVSGDSVPMVVGVPETLAVLAFQLDPSMPAGYCDTVDEHGWFVVSELFRCDELDSLWTGPTVVDEDTWGRVKALYR